MAPAIRCREIEHADFVGVAALLHRGFPERSTAALSQWLRRLSDHATPAGYPRYGFVLEADGALVGAILVIFSISVVDGKRTVRGNVSSWYVEPAFRSYAALLSSRALSYKDVTYLNLSPAPHTWPILDAQGYVPLSTGVFVAVPALMRVQRGARVVPVAADLSPGDDLSPDDVRLLGDHAGFGCTSVICIHRGRRYPFVFGPRRWMRLKGIPVTHADLAFCRTLDEFAHFAGPLGRFLARRFVALVFIDANGPIRGLAGKYAPWGPKFYRGPTRPHLGDVAYTERTMFDL